MSNRDWLLYAEDILESLDLIQDYTREMTWEQFHKDRKTIDAVVRNFEIIGEASRFIPQEVRERYPDVDWAGMLGLRNRIAHEYFVVSPHIIWHIANEELPALREEMTKILQQGKGHGRRG